MPAEAFAQDDPLQEEFRDKEEVAGLRTSLSDGRAPQPRLIAVFPAAPLAHPLDSTLACQGRL